MPPSFLSPIVRYQQITLSQSGEINPNAVKAFRENEQILFIAKSHDETRQNADWLQYEAWLAEGNEPDPPDPVPSGASAPRVELSEPMDPAIKQYIDDQIDQLKGG